MCIIGNHLATAVISKRCHIFHVVPAEDEFPEALTGVVPRHQRCETLEHVIVGQPRQEEPVLVGASTAYFAGKKNISRHEGIL
jgi:hypothetical protein